MSNGDRARLPKGSWMEHLVFSTQYGSVDLGKKEPRPSEGCSANILPLGMIPAPQNHIMWVLVRNAESQTPTPDLLNQNLLLIRPPSDLHTLEFEKYWLELWVTL